MACMWKQQISAVIINDFIVCLFIFPVRKFLDHEVQVPMGFLTRPVTTDHAHDDAGTDQHAHDDEHSLHHASVPWMLPKTRAMMIAEMNMPVMMYNKSI